MLCLDAIYLRQRRYVYVFACVRLSVCLCVRLFKNANMDLDEMLHVDRRRDIDELKIYLLSQIRIIVRMPEPDSFLP